MGESSNLRQKLWSFVNSGLGIWFLSTAVVGLASMGYTSWRTTHDKNIQTAEMVSKLDREISSRLLNALIASENYQAQTDGSIKPNLGKELLYPPGHDKMLIPEFADRNLRSLLYELSSLAPENTVVLGALKKAEEVARQYEVAVRLNADGGFDFKSGVEDMCHSRWESVLQAKREFSEGKQRNETETPAPPPNRSSELDQRRKQLIEEMFSTDKSTRIAATTLLIHEWASDPKLFSQVLETANRERSNKSGVINTLVLFQSLDPKILRPHAEELLDFLEAVKQNGNQTQNLIRSLKTSMDIPQTPPTAE